MSFLGKSYTSVSSENFDEYMKALGVPEDLRKIGAAAKPIVTLTESGGVYSLSVKSTVKEAIINFKLGEEFEETTVDGRKCKSTFSMSGNVLTQIQKGPKTSTITRTFTDSELITVFKVDNVVSTRISKV